MPIVWWNIASWAVLGLLILLIITARRRGFGLGRKWHTYKWTICKWASVGLLVLLIVFLGTIATVSWPQHPIEPGCYWKDRLVLYVECNGFSGAKFVGFVLSLPLIVFPYAPLFFVSFLVTGQIVSIAVYQSPFFFLLLVLLLWLAFGLAWPIRWVAMRIRREERADTDSRNELDD